MLRILDEQMAHLAKRTKRRFATMIEEYLRAHFTSWLARLSDAELRAWVEHALDKTERYGVSTEPEAAQLILLFLVLGADADERLPWVQETLASRVLAPVGKVKRLITLAREHRVAGVEHVVVYEGMGS
jgi:hypothetical protein